MILMLVDFGIGGMCCSLYIGIWIGDRKIGAIGVAVRRCITFHGLALNVNTDLSYFQRIVPCGLAWADVTSMALELGAEQNMERVRESFLHNFAELFAYSKVEKRDERFDFDPDQTADREAPCDSTIRTTETA